MFPIPCFFLLMEDGSKVPLPPGGVKKIAYTRGVVSGTNTKRSMALLLDDGSLYTQGDNAWGECADGTTTPFYDHWKLSASNVADVFGAGMVFIVKYNDNTLQFAGSQAQLTGTSNTALVWTNLPTTISGVISGANLANVSGGLGNTLWKLNSGYIYGSGPNTNGCLGSGNSNTFSTPRLISQTCVRAFGLNNATSYLNGNGGAFVSGATQSIGGPGTADQTQTFIAVNLGVTAYIKEWMTNESRSFAIASTGAADNVNYLYARGYGANTSVYVKDTTFGPFTTFKIIDGGQSHFLIIDDELYALGAQPEVLGLARSSTSEVTTPALVPVPTGEGWDLTKLTYIVDIKPDNIVDGTPIAAWMVYDGNLFYTGNPIGFFGKTANVNKFTNVPETAIVLEAATAIHTSAIGPAVVGGKKQLTYTTTPPGSKVTDIVYSSSDDSVMTIDSTGMMTFVSQGTFSANMGAKNSQGVDLDDGSGGWAEELSLYTHPTTAMTIGQTFQITYDIGPTDADTLPDMEITYTTTDATVASVHPTTGLVTAVGEGDCFVGTTANYQNGAAVVSNTAWLEVSA